jgi:hypothetical protein
MSHAISNESPKNPSSAALWAILIFIFLLIGAINFVQSFGENDEHSETPHTEQPSGHQVPAEAAHH